MMCIEQTSLLNDARSGTSFQAIQQSIIDDFKQQQQPLQSTGAPKRISIQEFKQLKHLERLAQIEQQKSTIWDVFLSHRWANNGNIFASLFNEKLLKVNPNFVIFLDKEIGKKGFQTSDLKLFVEHTINFVIFVTRDIEKSKWVTIELQSAFEYKCNIIPIYNASEPFPLSFDANSNVDRAWKDLVGILAVEFHNTVDDYCMMMLCNRFIHRPIDVILYW